MKKISVKKQLVDFMIANGNDFRYTDMIKATLRICKGKNYEYRREYDRGFYATNFSSGSTHGYMVNGGGDCGVYKNENGRWSAKYYTKSDKVNYFVNRQINMLSNLVSMERYRYDINMNKISEIERGTRDYSERFNYYISQYRNNVDRYKSETRKSILKSILKLDKQVASELPDSSGNSLVTN
jgi:hypothetical protein